MWGVFAKLIGRFAVDKITKPMPYTDTYNKAIIRQKYLPELEVVKKRILEGKARYEGVAATLGNGIPW